MFTLSDHMQILRELPVMLYFAKIVEILITNEKLSSWQITKESHPVQKMLIFVQMEDFPKVS